MRGGRQAECAFVTAAQRRGGGAPWESQDRVLIKVQLRHDESNVANSPLRATATYLRAQGISHMKKKLGRSLIRRRTRCAAVAAAGGRGVRRSRNWERGAMGTTGASCWSI